MSFVLVLVAALRSVVNRDDNDYLSMFYSNAVSKLTAELVVTLSMSLEYLKLNMLYVFPAPDTIM